MDLVLPADKACVSPVLHVGLIIACTRVSHDTLQAGRRKRIVLTAHTTVTADPRIHLDAYPGVHGTNDRFLVVRTLGCSIRGRNRAKVSRRATRTPSGRPGRDSRARPSVRRIVARLVDVDGSLGTDCRRDRGCGSGLQLDLAGLVRSRGRLGEYLFVHARPTGSRNSGGACGCAGPRRICASTGANVFHHLCRPGRDLGPRRSRYARPGDGHRDGAGSLAISDV